MNKLTLATLTCVAAGLLTLAACTAPDAEAQDKDGVDHKSMWENVDDAVCLITPTEGNSCKGVVHFVQDGAKVRMSADIEGLKPGAKHGFHIHQYGDITGSKGKTAGGHYNPAGHDHAGPADTTRHAGDLGNITADADGKAHYELTIDNVSIAGMLNPIIGRGMIIHAGTDDLKSQPTGAAGARIGMGVIGIAKSK